MTETYSSSQARKNLSEIMNSTKYNKEIIYVTCYDRQKVAIVPIELLKNLKATTTYTSVEAREQFSEIMMQVKYKGAIACITFCDKPRVAIVSIGLLERLNNTQK